jgi:hypothetical protein
MYIYPTMMSDSNTPAHPGRRPTRHTLYHPAPTAGGTWWRKVVHPVPFVRVAVQVGCHPSSLPYMQMSGKKKKKKKKKWHAQKLAYARIEDTDISVASRIYLERATNVFNKL